MAKGKENVKKSIEAENGGDLAPFFFHQGTNYRAYEYLGAHKVGSSFVFRVWAPNAKKVSVVGDFNDWNTTALPMKKITQGGVWEAYSPENCAFAGQNYKFYITGKKGISHYKADPYGRFMQKTPETASILTNPTSYVWNDASWLEVRKGNYTRENVMKLPLNIYEVHIGSWKRHEDKSVLSWREIAEQLAIYVKQMGYTHIELLPITEFPYDGSWGYQVGCYYAPTSRFGTPDDFRYFVDTMHQAGIGVILDWVPAHFPKDEYGLYEFDGQPLYECQGADRMEIEGWGTRRFDVGREEVQSFLVSNAVYFAKEFHIDGLRVDAVSSMLYLDYMKNPGEWVPNIYGGNECLEAIAFFRKLNSVMATDFPDVMMIAEESTAWKNVTRFDDNGLGFTLKWNMGWMNDTLRYAETDPIFRIYEHNKMNFSIAYAYSENYVLPISHDEVVHGKKSLLDRFVGPYEQKFAGMRTYLAYMMTHPGKKLLFMGCEIGMFREWDYKDSIEWFMTDYEMHAKMQKYVSDLNHFYLSHNSLWERDKEMEGFCWIDADNSEQSIYSYRRIDKDGKELVVLLNFVPIKRENFLLAVPFKGVWKEQFNSDATIYGGEGTLNSLEYKTEPCMLRGYSHAINITVPPMSALIFSCVKKSPIRKIRTKENSNKKEENTKNNNK